MEIGAGEVARGPGPTEGDLEALGHDALKEKDRKHWEIRYAQIAQHIADVASCRTASEQNASVVDVATAIINPLVSELLDMDAANEYSEKNNGRAYRGEEGLD